MCWLPIFFVFTKLSFVDMHLCVGKYFLDKTLAAILSKFVWAKGNVDILIVLTCDFYYRDLDWNCYWELCDCRYWFSHLFIAYYYHRHELCCQIFSTEAPVSIFWIELLLNWDKVGRTPEARLGSEHAQVS